MSIGLSQGTFKGRPFTIQDATNATYEAAVDANGALSVTGNIGLSSALPAGDNNIGNVDVATMPSVVISSLPDPHAARPTLLSVCGTTTTIGNTQIVVGPAAGLSHYVVAFCIQNEAATANTMRLMNATAPIWRAFAQNQGDGLAMSFAAGREWKVGNANPIMLNLSAATVCGYSVTYFTSAA